MIPFEGFPDLSEQRLDEIATQALAHYASANDAERQEWCETVSKAMKFVLQDNKDMQVAWQGASNSIFPLVATASLQYHARAFPPLFGGIAVAATSPPSPQLDAEVNGFLTQPFRNWQTEHDTMLLALSILGSGFFKIDVGAEGILESVYVSPMDLVVPFRTKSLEDAPIINQKLCLTGWDIHSKQTSGFYRTEAVTIPQDAFDVVYPAFEQHTWLDLDGDGKEEPWILTVMEKEQKLLKIAPGWDTDSTEEDALHKRMHFFSDYQFIPHPLGSIYGFGFGMLLTHINSGINNILNSLVDSGLLANAAGGFLGRGAKIRSDTFTFSPREWKRLDAPVDDISKAVWQLPVSEPSATLLNLLQFLVGFGHRLAGVSDPMSGEAPSSDTSAIGSAAAIEQGAKLYNATFERVWRGLRKELAIWLERLKQNGNALAVQFQGTLEPAAASKDESTMDLVQQQQAALIQQQQQAKMENDRQKLALDAQGLALKQQEMQLKAMQFVASLQEEQRLNNARILELEARAASLLKEAQTSERETVISELNAIAAMQRQRNAEISATISALSPPIRETPPTAGVIPPIGQSLLSAPAQTGVMSDTRTTGAGPGMAATPPLAGAIGGATREAPRVQEFLG